MPHLKQRNRPPPQPPLERVLPLPLRHRCGGRWRIFAETRPRMAALCRAGVGCWVGNDAESRREFRSTHGRNASRSARAARFDGARSFALAGRLAPDQRHRRIATTSDRHGSSLSSRAVRRTGRFAARHVARSRLCFLRTGTASPRHSSVRRFAAGFAARASPSGVARIGGATRPRASGYTSGHAAKLPPPVSSRATLCRSSQAKLFPWMAALLAALRLCGRARSRVNRFRFLEQ